MAEFTRIGAAVEGALERLQRLIVDEAKAAAWERREWELRVGRIGLPAALLEFVLSGEDTNSRPWRESAPDRFLAWATQDQRRLVVLSGKAGTGKSAAAARWAADQAGARWAAAKDFAQEAAEAEWKKDPGLSERLHARYFRALVLILDDAGLNESAAESAHVERLLCSRYEAQLLTLVTTNLNLKQFATRYGERVTTRADESGAFRQFTEVLRKGKA